MVGSGKVAIEINRTYPLVEAARAHRDLEERRTVGSTVLLAMTPPVAAARIHEHGGPEVIRLESVALGEPGPGEARVRNGAIGLNFYDVYERTGLYPVTLPATLGSESAGVVEAVGEQVTEVKAGDRVAVTTGPGNYAEAMLAPADALVPLPSRIDETTSAAGLTKAMTVEYLLERCFHVRRGHTILFHRRRGRRRPDRLPMGQGVGARG